MGSRKPVLFIEGDGIHSIDARLYPLLFKDYSVKSLGSCNKVIEATRTFNDLTGFDSRGIVDRDRRDDKEVAYLRGKRIMVPEVAFFSPLGSATAFRSVAAPGAVAAMPADTLMSST